MADVPIPIPTISAVAPSSGDTAVGVQGGQVRRLHAGPSFSQLSAPTGADLVGTQTGSTTRTLKDKLGDFLSVKDFGAKGDGVTDDTPAIQAAINTGKPLYWPPGSYRTTAPITASNADLAWTGSGQNAVQIAVDHAGAGLVYSSSTVSRQVVLRGLSFVTSNAAATRAVDIGFPSTSDIDQVQVVLDDVRIAKIGAGIWTQGCIRLSNVTNPILSKFVAEGDFAGTPYGLSLEGQTLDAALSNTRFYLMQDAIRVSGTSEGLTLNDFIAVTVDRGVYINTTGLEPWLAATNFHINARSAGIDATNRAQITLSNGLLYANSTISSPGWTGIKATASVVGRADNISIANVEFNKAAYGGSTVGISLAGARYVPITGCQFIGVDTGIDYDASCVDVRPFGNVYIGVTNQLLSAGTARREALSLDYSASTFNALSIKGAATGGSPTLEAVGGDSDIGLNIAAKGGGTVSLMSRGTSVFQAFAPASAVTRMRVRADTTGNGVQLIAEGETNVDLRLTPSGTGAVRFGTHTANADAPITGYITIKDAGGALRKLAVIA